MSNITFSEQTEKHQEKIRRLSAHKRRTVAMSEWIDDMGFDNPKFDNLRNCQSWILFREYYTIDKIKLAAANFCNNHLLCPLCAIRRAARALKTYYAKYEECLRQNPNLRIHYAVLTIKNGDNLGERYNHLQKCVRKLIARRRDALEAKAGKKSKQYALKSSLANVVAGAYSFEVKRGKNLGQWHPHVNILILTDDELDYKTFQEEWVEITGDSKIIKITPKRNGDKGAFVEIFKYAMKFSEMSYQDTFTAWETLLGKRLFGCFGEFWGLKIDKSSDLSEEIPYTELFYSFYGGIYKKTTKDGVKALKRAFKNKKFKGNRILEDG
jgi:plasmid rolling circle replication initiator protein Rep